MSGKSTVVHVTHEAVAKIGGIGAVLNGFFTSSKYLERVERSVLVSPIFDLECSVFDRLGENGNVLYSSLDGVCNTKYADRFRQIESYFNTNIVYGTKKFVDSETGIESSPEVLLFKVNEMAAGPVDLFKGKLFSEFGIQCDRYEHIWEFEQYVRLAPAALEALKAIDADSDESWIYAHEFMGMPTALAAMLDEYSNFKTGFYAHETATVRRITEKRCGHDSMFYNVLEAAEKEGKYCDELFGDQNDYFKHGLISAARRCDRVFAVGDFVKKELRFLNEEFADADIDIVYNGIPAYEISLHQRNGSRDKLGRYCENLLGFRPDVIFTHVTRLVQSKGLWRDLKVLEQLDSEFAADGRTGVYYLLSTQTAQKSREDVEKIEADYDWPVAHREGWPDMSGGEAELYTLLQKFNAKSRNIKAVFINQFGFAQEFCGLKMPEDMEFMDIRKGSDVEFGMSIYEPFGIAQLESLTFGGICVVSNVCGCAGFVLDVCGGISPKNVIIADYTQLGDGHEFKDAADMLKIGSEKRQEIEKTVSSEIAKQVLERLAKNDIEAEKLIESGYDCASKMSWDVVVEHYIRPCGEFRAKSATYDQKTA